MLPFRFDAYSKFDVAQMHADKPQQLLIDSSLAYDEFVDLEIRIRG
jgi:hypothetical protein